MHILKLDSEIHLGPDNVIPPGEYLTEDVLGGQMLVMAGGGVMRPLEERRVPEFFEAVANGTPLKVNWYGAGTPRECTSLLIGRTGGLGDLTLLTPILREIKRRWPTVKIAVACIKELGQSIQNLPFVDEVLQYPVPVATANGYDGWIWLENAIERNPDAKTLHSVDCVAKFIGLDLPEGTDKRQAYVVTEKERGWVNYAWPRIPGVRRICIQIKASAQCRTYDPAKTRQVMAKLLQEKWEVFVLASPGEARPSKEPVPGLRIISDGHDFRQRAALVESSDVFLGPDSSLVHVAGALGIPAVALYGPFPWQVRTAYCPTTRALSRMEGFEKTCPCFHHSTLQKPFPDHCPTKAKGVCGVLDAITPEQILKAINDAVPEAEGVAQFPSEVPRG